MTKNWRHKDLCALADHDAGELLTILDTATAFKGVGERNLKKVPALRGRTLVNLFVEPSTRTRISFELAAMRLSADVVNIAATSSSLEKGETLLDTARNLQALRADLIVVRHKSAGSARFLAERLDASVINAGDGAHEHPTQGLLDAFTRVARSNIQILTKLGAVVTLVGPPTLVPASFGTLGVRIAHSIDEVIGETDVINLLRIQHERQKKEYFPGLGEYTARFGLTRGRAARLRPECLIMHPGPMNRGVEIDSDVADGRGSVILDQVTNGLAVRMAVLYLCSGGAPMANSSES